MSGEKNILVIQNGMSARAYWAEIWRHRELLFFFAWRDILVRYKQTVIGVSWVLIRPLLTMVILTAVFGRVANLPSGDTPYAILVFTGLLPWFYFSNALGESSNSIVTNSNMISKVFFPRIIVPASTVVVGAVDFAISFLVLLLLMVWFHVSVSWPLLLLPILGLWVAVLSLGLGLWFSALTVRYRDFRHIVPFLLQLGVYASPVGYSSSLIPAKWMPIYYLNPIAGIIDSFRWSVIGTVPDMYGIGYAVIITITVFILGVRYFRAREFSFADDL